MSKSAVSTHSAPAPAGPYSQAVEINGFLYTSGLGAQDPETGAVGDDIAVQTRQCLENIRSVLAVRGLTMDDCIKTTVHLSDLRDFSVFNEVYGTFFHEPYPVRTTVQSTLYGTSIEIDVIAAASK